MIDLHSILSQQLKTNLPGDQAHRIFAPYRYTTVSKDEVVNFRKSAVAIHLFPKESKWYFILIERSEYDGTHSKQIAFPGGKCDPDDSDHEFTARRESFEEIGLDWTAGEFIGTLSEVNIPVSRFNVLPHLFVHNSPIEGLRKNEREVNEILFVQLDELLSHPEKHVEEIQLSQGMKMKVPCFILQEKIVWGATALMLNELKLLLNENSLH